MEQNVILNAKDSDPEKLKWMMGFPPEKEKIISAKDGSFFEFPALRYSVNHMREFFPTRNVSVAKTDLYKFRHDLDKKIDEITFVPWNVSSTSPMTFAESLEKNYVDGIIIVHNEKIVYEKYFGGLESDGLHAAMSVTKSVTGLLATILIAEKMIHPEKPIEFYIPELANSGFAGATVQQVLDMTTAIKYSEDYNDPKAEIWEFSNAGNVYHSEKAKGPKSYYEYLPTVQKLENQKHGEVFGYKTVNAEIVGWLISKVTGRTVADLLSELVWKPMGAAYDAFFQIDSAGKDFAGGGLNMNLRDMALLGEMIRNEGYINHKQVIPKKAAKELFGGGSVEAFAKDGEYPSLKGWSYHNLWWMTNNKHGAFMARGVHGQAIYIDPVAKMVIARFSSNPLSSNKFIDPLSIPAYEAVADYLVKK